MPPVGFEPTIPAGERPQIYVLDRAATGTGNTLSIQKLKLGLKLYVPCLYPLLPVPYGTDLIFFIFASLYV